MLPVIFCELFQSLSICCEICKHIKFRFCYTDSSIVGDFHEVKSPESVQQLPTVVSHAA